MGTKIADISVGVGVDVSGLPSQLASARQTIGTVFQHMPALNIGQKIADELAAIRNRTEFSIRLSHVEGVGEAKAMLNDLDNEIQQLQATASGVKNLKVNFLAEKGFSANAAQHFSTQQGLPISPGMKFTADEHRAVSVIDRQLQGLVARTAELEGQRTAIVGKFGAQRLAHANAEATGVTAAMSRTGTALTLPSVGFGKFGFALQQASFGAQDFVSVLTQPGMGLAGALRATSNNISQVFAVMGPMTGAIAGLATAVGVSLVTAWLSSGDAAESAAEKMKRAADEIEKLNERITASLDIVRESTATRRKTESEGPRSSDDVEKDIRAKRVESKNLDDEIKQKEQEAAGQRRILAEERKRHVIAAERGVKLPPMSDEEKERREKIAADAEEQARQLRQRRAIITGEANTDDESGVLIDRNKAMGRKGRFEGEIKELEKERDDAKARELPELERDNLTGDKKLDEQLKRLDAGNERFRRKREEQQERETDREIDEQERRLDQGNERFRKRRDKEKTDREQLDRDLLPERAKRFAAIAADIDKRKEDIERLSQTPEERKARMQALAERGERQLRAEQFRGAGEKVGITQFTDMIQKGLFGNDMAASAKQTAANTQKTTEAVNKVNESLKSLKTGYSA